MDKNRDQERTFGSQRKPFELGKELENEEEDKCNMSYYTTKMSWRNPMEGK